MPLLTELGKCFVAGCYKYAAPLELPTERMLRLVFSALGAISVFFGCYYKHVASLLGLGKKSIDHLFSVSYMIHT